MTRSRTPRSPLWLRWMGVGLAAALLLWIPIEDQNPNMAMLFAAAWCAWFAVRLAQHPDQSSSRISSRLAWRWMVLGALAGVLVTPLAIIFLVFKIGWHAHEVPDFTVPQMLDVLARSPIWAAGGALVGLGSGLSKEPDSTDGAPPA